MEEGQDVVQDIGREEGGRLVHLFWIDGVYTYRRCSRYRDPQYLRTTPWEETKGWEQEAAMNVFAQLQSILLNNHQQYLTMRGYDGGRLVHHLWVEQMYRFGHTPQNRALCSWEVMDKWERQVNGAIYEGIRAGVMIQELVTTSMSAKRVVDRAASLMYRALFGPYTVDPQQELMQKRAALNIAHLYVDRLLDAFLSISIGIRDAIPSPEEWEALQQSFQNALMITYQIEQSLNDCHHILLVTPSGEPESTPA